MPIHVICPGCLKRFHVNVRFAGMEGPCPNCHTVISIPKESVKMHGDEHAAGQENKGSKRHSLLRPFPRLERDWNAAQIGRYVGGVLGTVLFTLLLGCLPMPAALRTLIGIVGLGFAAYPLAQFGYNMLLDREQIFVLGGEELHLRLVVVATGYVILWLLFEYCLSATQAEGAVSGLYFAAFAVLAMLLAHPLLELKTPDAFLHYCIFGLSITLLRFCIGFGWYWASADGIRYSLASPPPLLPGM